MVKRAGRSLTIATFLVGRSVGDKPAPSGPDAHVGPSGKAVAGGRPIGGCDRTNPRDRPRSIAWRLDRVWPVGPWPLGDKRLAGLYLTAVIRPAGQGGGRRAIAKRTRGIGRDRRLSHTIASILDIAGAPCGPFMASASHRLMLPEPSRRWAAGGSSAPGAERTRRIGQDQLLGDASASISRPSLARRPVFAWLRAGRPPPRGTGAGARPVG
jgi:hypothetical protein